MSQSESYYLMIEIRKDESRLFAVYNLRGSGYGKSIWRVDANIIETGEVLRFRNRADYVVWKNQ